MRGSIAVLHKDFQGLTPCCDKTLQASVCHSSSLDVSSVCDVYAIPNLARNGSYSRCSLPLLSCLSKRESSFHAEMRCQVLDRTILSNRSLNMCGSVLSASFCGFSRPLNTFSKVLLQGWVAVPLWVVH